MLFVLERMWIFLVVFLNLVPFSWEQGLCALTDTERIDCLPNSDTVTEELCQSRNCCYNDPLGGANYRVPICFFPRNFPGYKIDNLESVVGGTKYSISRTEQSFLPSEISKLAVEVLHIGSSILRIRITDPDNKRFEVPYVYEEQQMEKPLEDMFKITINENPFTIKVENRLTSEAILDTSVGPLLYSDQFIQFSTRLPHFYVYGLGEHRNPFKITTTRQKVGFWNRDQPPGTNINLYGSQPFAMLPTRKGNSFGLFLLNANAMEAELQNLPALTFRTIGGIIDLFLYAGPTADDVIRQHWSIVHLPYFQPYWAHGFHLCRYGYADINDLRSTINRMRDAGFQYDVQWTDIDVMDRHLVFTFDKEKWNGLPDLVRDLHDNDMRYTPINDPCIGVNVTQGSYDALEKGLQLDLFIKQESGSHLLGRVWPGDCYFPDFTHPQAANWWKEQIDVFNQTAPFDGFWIDMNEPANFVEGSVTGCPNNNLDRPWFVPEIGDKSLTSKTLCPSSKQYLDTQYNLHNLYGHIEAKVTFEAISSLTPDKRYFILTRANFAGTGRYAGHWSGDNSATWNDMRHSIIEVINYNMYGMPFIGADICGFFVDTNEELCMRWMQLGAFYPFMRNHNTIDTINQDPGVFSEPARMAMKKALLIRYRLLPYWYTLSYRAHTAYETVVQSLYYICPQDFACGVIDTQFLIGHAIMVAPVLEKNAKTMSVYFPEGEWYDYYDLSKMDVKTAHWKNFPVDNYTIGLYIRGGYVIPTHIIDESKNALQNRNSHFCLIVTLKSNAISNGWLYWDNGETLNGPYTLISFTAFDGGVFASNAHRTYTDPIYVDKIVVAGIKSPSIESLTVDGSEKSFSVNGSVLTIDGLSQNINSGYGLTVRWSY